MALTQNFSSCYESTAYQTAFTPLITPPAHTHLNRHNAPAFTWTTTQRAIILTLSLLLLHRTLSSFKSRNTEPAKQKLKRPSQVPYSIPILGNLPQFLYAPQELARQISYVPFPSSPPPSPSPSPSPFPPQTQQLTPPPPEPPSPTPPSPPYAC